jgi:hypothetical protein
MIPKYSAAAYFIPAVFLCLFLVIQQCGAETFRDSLTSYGHSFVKIKTEEGMIIYIDPFNVNEFADSADVVLITHEHSDHNEISRIRQKSTCQVIRAANTISGDSYNSFTIGQVTIQGVPAYNNYHSRTNCVGFVLSFHGIKIYHAGDTGNITEMANLAGQQITYALLPMDGIYTMTPEAATTAAAAIQASHDIPIHTMPPPDTYSDAVVSRFTSPNKLIVRPGSAIELTAGITGIEKSFVHPEGYILGQNYPNPFNPETTIRYQLPVNCHVLLEVFNLLGKKVATLVDRDQSSGSYSVQFRRDGLASDIFFYRIRTENFSDTKKMLMIK